MPAFSTSGTAGAVLTKVWMSYVADKYTMLSPYDDANSFINSSSTTLVACTLINQFNLKNASFGAFTTAPDGTTNTAQKIVEDNTNSQHTVQAGLVFPQIVFPSLRVAGIFKAAERTRIAFRVSDGNGITAYVYAGFDLAGGQIAYGAQTVGGGSARFTITNQAIYPVGAGFYLCFIDFQSLSGSSPPGSYRFVLDNGTGTGAPSISYAGDGASGVYGWKTSVLPAQAWNINSQCFFDDFNDPTMANIDLNGTLAPGFDWYVQQDFRNTLFWLNTIPIPPGSLSASGSILHIPPSPISPGSTGNEGPGISTFGNSHTRNPAPGVGKGWRMPFMFETKMAFDYPNLMLGGDGSFWGGYIEFANAISANQTLQSGAVNGGEIDFCETGFQVNESGGQTAGFFYDSIIGGQAGLLPTFLGVQANGTGFPPFQTAFIGSYNVNIIVGSGGNFYKSTEASNPETPPSTHWVSYTGPRPLVLTDPSQQHVYTEICVPFNRVTKDGGCFLHFYDGVYVGAPAAWSPNGNIVSGNNNQYMHTTDWMRFFIIIVAGTGYGMSVDYVRVSQ